MWKLLTLVALSYGERGEEMTAALSQRRLSDLWHRFPRGTKKREAATAESLAKKAPLERDEHAVPTSSSASRWVLGRARAEERAGTFLLRLRPS